MSRPIKLAAVVLTTLAALFVGTQGAAVSSNAGPGDGWCC